MERSHYEETTESKKPVLIEVTTPLCGGYLLLNKLRHLCRRDSRFGALSSPETSRVVDVQHFSDGRTRVGCLDITPDGLCGAVFKRVAGEGVQLERLNIKKRCGFLKDLL